MNRLHAMEGSSMHAVLGQLNGLPGVAGSLVCADDGRVLAHAFPAIFDPAAIQEAARALSDAFQALEPTSEVDDLLDLRFKDVRLLGKAFPGHLVAVLASRTTNLQLLVLALSAATAKLERVAVAVAPAPAPEGQPAARPPAVGPPPPSHRAAEGSRVAAPATGLEELRRRLAAGPPAGGGRGPPSTT